MIKMKALNAFIVAALLLVTACGAASAAGNAQSLADAFASGQYAFSGSSATTAQDGCVAVANADAGAFSGNYDASALAYTAANNLVRGAGSTAQAMGLSLYAQSSSSVDPSAAQTMSHAETYYSGIAATQADASGEYAESASSASADAEGSTSDSMAYAV